MLKPKNTNSHDARIAVLEAALTQHVQALKDRMDLKFEAAERARALQFDEFMRRLGELNGEAGRLREIQATYIPREVAEGRFMELGKGVGELERFQANMLGRMAIVGLVVGIIAAVLVKWVVP